MAVGPVVIGTVAALGIIAEKIMSRQLDDIRQRLLTQELLGEIEELVRGVVSQAASLILSAIDNVSRQIDEDVSLDAIALADRALFVDGDKNGDAGQALGNSFQAAHRLALETDPVFATALIHTVNLRLALLRHVKDGYFCDRECRHEFEGYIGKMNGWCRQIDDVITGQHTVKVELRTVGTRPAPRVRWESTHARAGTIVATFIGEIGDISPATRDRVKGRALASRSRAITAERRDSGLLEMEKPAQTWAECFRRDSGTALLRGIASRYGFAAFMAALLRSEEYEARHGDRFPAAGPLASALDL